MRAASPFLKARVRVQYGMSRLFLEGVALWKSEQMRGCRCLLGSSTDLSRPALCF